MKDFKAHFRIDCGSLDGEILTSVHVSSHEIIKASDELEAIAKSALRSYEHAMSHPVDPHNNKISVTLFELHHPDYGLVDQNRFSHLDGSYLRNAFSDFQDNKLIYELSSEKQAKIKKL